MGHAPRTLCSSSPCTLCSMPTAINAPVQTGPPAPPLPVTNLQQPVHLLHSGGLGQLKHAVGDAAVGQGHTDGEAVQLALQLWEDEGDGGGAAGTGGSQVDQARPAAE